jgi:hypothetical protein
MLEVKRTLVKSVPELWAELSDPASLARHLAPFGSVEITRAVPESVVEWTGRRAGGRVRLESSGFGTRVVFQVALAGVPLPAAPEPAPGAPVPVPRAPEPSPPRRAPLWQRLLRLGRPAPDPGPRRAPDPAPAPPLPAPPPAAVPAMDSDAALLVLTDTLDALGRAHHRPYSRA